MLPFLGSAVSAGGMFAVATTFDAWFVYALVAWLIGLIAWSKYTEPALSPPYPVAGSGSSAADHERV